MPRRSPSKQSANGVSFYNSHEVDALNAHLQEMMRFLAGADYSVRLEANVFRVPGAELPLADVVLLAYPEARPHEARTTSISVEDEAELLDDCLSLRWLSPREQQSKARREQWMRDEFWRLLAGCVNYSNAQVISYNGTHGLPGYWVFWNFALLIHNPAQQKCVFLFGYACD